ncbi:PREDICTED: uncharacterized protein LOC105452158 isoform X1 [Wasmannia auropunctata]|uniref:uncharacterized protein LOC105452158 isoform X1 n=1 Tax=Wasmannia auropunctata TaxID=64793 RepID=UPI0005EECD4F|nr:PREDICTED: uncharacterized protein LOC105452158 isoform X1 [Wasmannia auropunctata]
MTRFIVFVLLLLIGRHVRGVTENIVTFTSGSTVTLKAESTGSALRCTLETNRGEELEYLRPGYRQVREDVECIDTKTCSFRINKANDSHAGVWKVTAYKENESDVDSSSDDVTGITEVFSYKLYIYQEKAAVPSQYIEVYDGHYVHMKHSENYKNLTACNLTGPKMKSINLLTEKRDNFQLLGQCGVRMKVTATFEGSWKLDAVVNDYMVYRTSFNVDVHQLEGKDPNDTLVIQWTRGSPGIISLSGLPKICQIVDPNGVTVATSIGKCYHQVKVATVAHEGVWLARYNMYGMLEPVEQKFRVETLERFIFNTNVTRTENGNTVLLCRLEIKDARPASCNFVRPDGIILYMTPVVGTERYTAYIRSADNRERTDYKILECAITIRKLEDVDYGAWRCDLRIPYNARSYGSVLHVDYPNSRENSSAKGEAVKTRADGVYVKRGDPFTIKCIADSVLKYCWLRSPNGTSYSVTQDTEAASPFVLHYQGNGLAFGECGAEISTAVDSDNGQWSCLMGVADAGEITAMALVTVTETYLVAEQTEIAVSPRNDPVLSCHILPRMLDRTVHYCRWIRPDGYGIYNDISHRYTANSSYSECRLVILDYRPEEDDGNWTCVAGLTGKNGQLEEAWDQIGVHHVSESTIYIVNSFTFIAISVMLTIFVCGVLGYVWTRYSLRRSLPREVPAYCPPGYYPTKSLQSKLDREYQY